MPTRIPPTSGSTGRACEAYGFTRPRHESLDYEYFFLNEIEVLSRDDPLADVSPM